MFSGCANVQPHVCENLFFFFLRRESHLKLFVTPKNDPCRAESETRPAKLRGWASVSKMCS